MKIIHNSERGFTLIELLIVVIIIGILSALLTSNFIGVRQRARDGQRKSDVRQIQSALELYRADQGSYPSPSLNNCQNSTSIMSPDCVTSTYMKKIPVDPSTASYYSYTSNGSTYSVTSCLENGNDLQKDSTPPNPNPCGNGTYSFTVQNQ